MTVLIDNFSVLSKARGLRRTNPLAGSCATIWWEVKGALETTPDIDFVWIPSHGKKIGEWQPPEGFSEPECRWLNDRADKAVERARDAVRLQEKNLRVTRDKARLRAKAALLRCWRGHLAFRERYPSDDEGNGGGGGHPHPRPLTQAEDRPGAREPTSVGRTHPVTTIRGRAQASVFVRPSGWTRSQRPGSMPMIRFPRHRTCRTPREREANTAGRGSAPRLISQGP